MHNIASHDAVVPLLDWGLSTDPSLHPAFLPCLLLGQNVMPFGLFECFLYFSGPEQTSHTQLLKVLVAYINRKPNSNWIFLKREAINSCEKYPEICLTSGAVSSRTGSSSLGTSGPTKMWPNTNW